MCSLFLQMEKSVQNCAESLVRNLESSGSDVCNIKRYKGSVYPSIYEKSYLMDIEQCARYFVIL